MPTVMYPAYPVFDPATGEPLLTIRGEAGRVVQRGTETDVTLVDSNGLSMSQPLYVTDSGFLPTFGVVEGLTQVDFISGDVRMPITSPTGLEQSAAVSAAAAEEVVTRADAGEFIGPEGPQGPQGVPGVNAVPTTTAMVEYLANDTPVRDAYAPRDGVQTTAASKPLLRLKSNGPTGQYTLALEDTPNHDVDVLNIQHSGDGTAGSTTQSYGLNIANQTGARAAICIHQYSANGAMIRLDNTDIAPTIQIWNTENPTKNPGGVGTGAFFQLRPYGEDVRTMYLTNDLVFFNATTKNMKVQSTASTAYTFGVDSAQNIPGLYITKTGTGAGAAAFISNAGTSPGVDLYQNGATGIGFRITAGTGHSTYAFQIKGQTYGGSFETALDGSNTQVLLINKKGTGAGEAIRLINAGTGSTLTFRDATAERAKVTAGGEYENLIAGAGIVLKAPGGTRYRITVSDAGVVTAVAA